MEKKVKYLEASGFFLPIDPQYWWLTCMGRSHISLCESSLISWERSGTKRPHSNGTNSEGDLWASSATVPTVCIRGGQKILAGFWRRSRINLETFLLLCFIKLFRFLWARIWHESDEMCNGKTQNISLIVNISSMKNKSIGKLVLILHNLVWFGDNFFSN